jgi:RimJ/RimL family protein N-acetyltransferase
VSRPLGDELRWTAARRPDGAPLRGERALVRAADPERDADALFAASHEDPSIWTYLPDGPYAGRDEFAAMLTRAAASSDPLFLTIATLPDERPSGMASYLRMAPEHGAIEIGHIWFGPALQRTVAATEAIYLLAAHAFDALGYRRLEWKCNALNAASRSAAERFGFELEGVFRKHMVVKGRNRDTAWYAIVDDDWPAVRGAFEAWLAASNFDAAGVQRRSLRELMAEARR